MSWYDDVANGIGEFVDNWKIGMHSLYDNVSDHFKNGNILEGIGIGSGVLGSVQLGEDLTEKNNIDEIQDTDREAFKNRINEAWDAAREAFSDVGETFANGNIFTDIATDVTNSEAVKDDLYDEITDEGLSVEDGAYLMQLNSMGENSQYGDTEDVLRHAEYKYFLENATADNIMTPEFKAGALSYLRDVKDVAEAYGTAADMNTEEHTKAYLDAAANVFPGGKERFYSVLSDVNEIALAVNNYEDAITKHMPGAPTSVYDAIEKNAYNNSPDWFKSMLDDDKQGVLNDTALLTFEEKFGKGPFEAKVESKLDSKSRITTEAENSVNAVVGGLAAAFKSTADTLNDELKLSGTAVKNSDKAKNDEFLNGFDKAIRGNETEYEV